MNDPTEEAHDPYPSYGTQIEVGFANGERSWTETADVIELLARALREHGIEFEPLEDTLQLANGWILQPDIRGYAPHDQGGVKTTTIIIARHLQIAENGLFEYQHARGADLQASFASGFKAWLQQDYPVLAEALLDTPTHCMTLSYSEPGQNDVRVVLGPTAHFARNREAAVEDHCFCPCCLFTNSFDTFRELFQLPGLLGLRLFVARDDEGEATADCRVNGYDWEPGKAALVEYAKTWPDRGYEFRKQFLVIQRQPIH